MWALVQSGTVTKIYSRPQAVTIDGVQHPSTIFSAWTEEARNAIGIYRVTRANQKDNFYYTNSTPTYSYADGVVTESITSTAKSLDDVNQVDEDGNPILDPDGNQMIALGLKSTLKAKVKTTASSLLQPTDWKVIRAAEGGTAVDSNTATYRAAVRTKSNSMETAIDGAADITALIALSQNTYYANGSIQTVATLNDWPDAP